MHLSTEAFGLFLGMSDYCRCYDLLTTTIPPTGMTLAQTFAVLGMPRYLDVCLQFFGDVQLVQLDLCKRNIVQIAAENPLRDTDARTWLETLTVVLMACMKHAFRPDPATLTTALDDLVKRMHVTLEVRLAIWYLIALGADMSKHLGLVQQLWPLPPPHPADPRDPPAASSSSQKKKTLEPPPRSSNGKRQGPGAIHPACSFARKHQRTPPHHMHAAARTK